GSMMRAILVAISAAALGGCIVSRFDPEPPQTPLPDALPAVQREAVQLPDPWWTLFDDPVLDGLVEEALAHNTDVAVAAARVAQARAALRMTNADRLPQLDVEAGATRSKNSADVLVFPGAQRTQTTYTVQGAVAFELDFWGRYERASESARAELLSTEL